MQYLAYRGASSNLSRRDGTTMNMRKPDTEAGRAALMDGAEAARTLLSPIKSEAESSDEPLLWWAGFFGTLAGYMTASVGPAASKVLAETFSPILDEIAKEKQQ